MFSHCPVAKTERHFATEAEARAEYLRLMEQRNAQPQLRK